MRKAILVLMTALVAGAAFSGSVMDAVRASVKFEAMRVLQTTAPAKGGRMLLAANANEAVGCDVELAFTGEEVQALTDADYKVTRDTDLEFDFPGYDDMEPLYYTVGVIGGDPSKCERYEVPKDGHYVVRILASVRITVVCRRPIYVDPLNAPVTPNASTGYYPGNALRTIQQGVDVALDKAVVRVAGGQTYDPFAVTNRELFVVNSDYEHPAVIDGVGKGRCVEIAQSVSNETTGATEVVPATNGLVTVSGFTLTNGTAQTGGGAWGGTFTSCRIFGCKATDGGGLYGAMARNCLIVGNAASAAGGGAAGCVLVNCTLTGNTAKSGASGLAKATGLKSAVYNSVVFGNEGAVQVEDGMTAYATFTARILFGEDWKLRANSPGVGGGLQEFVDDLIDLEGKPRRDGVNVTAGCYQSVLAPSAPFGVTVNGTDVSYGEGTGWTFDSATGDLTITASGTYVMSGAATGVTVRVEKEASFFFEDLSLKADKPVLSVKNGATLVLSGGTADLRGTGNVSGSVVITGGNIALNGQAFDTTPVNGFKDNVYCLTMSLPEDWADDAAVAIEGLPAYSTRGICAIDGKLNLWLPAGGGAFQVSDGAGHSVWCYYAIGPARLAYELFDPEVPLPEVGVRVNGQDISTRHAAGWAYFPSAKVLLFTVSGDYTVAGTNATCDLRIGTVADVALAFEDCKIKNSSGAVFTAVADDATLTVAGGTADLQGAANPEIKVVFRGGNVDLHGFAPVPQPTADGTRKVLCTTIDLPEDWAADAAVEFYSYSGASGIVRNVFGDYNLDGVRAIGGKLRLWLPDCHDVLMVVWPEGETNAYYSVDVDVSLPLCHCERLTGDELETGVVVDGEDAGWMQGGGWSYSHAERILAIRESDAPHAISGSATNFVLWATGDTSVRFDGLRLADEDSAALYVASGKTLRILGGTADIKGTEACEGAFVIDGGNICMGERAFATQPRNSAGQAVSCVTVEGLEGSVRLEGLEGYDTEGIRAIEGKVCLWLPDGDRMFTVNGVDYVVRVKGEAATAVRLSSRPDAVEYLDWDGTKLVRRVAFDVIALANSDNETIGQGKWYVVRGAVTTTNLKVGGAAHLILADGAKLTANASDYHAGIEVSRGNELSVYGQGGGTGELDAIGGTEHGAGIGVGDAATCGTVTINGGRITAMGGYTAAGIGGARNGVGGTVTVNGGVVTAYCRGYAGAGIGGGDNAGGGTVTINGGYVCATGADWGGRGSFVGAGIGGSDRGVCGAVTINGGTVKATAGSSYAGSDIGGGNNGAAGTVTIAGGSVWRTHGRGTAPKDPDGKDLHCVTVTCRGLADDALCRLSGLGAYGVRDIRALGGKLYLWLPNGVHSFEVRIDGPVKWTGSATVNGKDVSVTAEAGIDTLPVDYVDFEDGSNVLKKASAFRLGDFTEGNAAVIYGGYWYVVTNETTLSSLTVTNGMAHLILPDGAKLEVTSAAGDALVVYGQETGSGVLNATVGIGNSLTVNGGRIFSLLFGGVVHVTGGTVSSISYGKAPIVDGGGVIASFFDSLSNSAGQAVYRVTVEGTGGPSAPVVIEGLENYGTYGIYPSDSGTVFLWLPDGNHEFTVDGKPYFAEVSGAPTKAQTGTPVHSVAYLDWNGSGMEAKTCACALLLTAETTELGDGWYVVTNDVKTTNLRVHGTAKLILCDGVTLTATGEANEAGVRVTRGNGLVLYGQNDGTGALIATGGGNAAGIGGNFAGTYGYSGGTVTNNGVQVTATGGVGAAGIGGARKADGAYLTVNAGTVQASGGGDPASDIGRGQESTGDGTLTISGGSVKYSTGVTPKNAAGSTVYCVTVSGLGSLVAPVTIEGLEGYNLFGIRPIDGNVYLYLPNGDHIFVVNGEEWCAKVEDGATTATKLAETKDAYEYYDWNGSELVRKVKLGPFAVTSGLPTLSNDGWYVVTGTVSRSAALAIKGTAHLILADGATLTVTGSEQPGIQLNAGNSLFVYGQSGGSGTLVATGGDGCAGIGNENKDTVGSSGSLTVNGGVVHATGSGYGAGIGGSNAKCWGKWGNCGPVTVNGGRVTARAGSYAAGIGGAVNGSGAEVVIRGGTVDASGVTGIGHGKSWSTPDIPPSGTLKIEGGSVKPNGFSPAPTNAAGSAVHCVTVSGLEPLVPPVAIKGLEDYGVHDIYPIDGKVYLYLPNGDHSFSVGGVWAYSTHVAGAGTTASRVSRVTKKVEYLDWNGTEMVTKTRSAATVLAGFDTEIGNDSWYVVDRDVTTADLKVNGTAHLILADGATLTASAVSGGALAVYGQANGSGVLTVSGDIACDLTVNGGRISAAKATGEAFAVNGGTVRADRGGKAMAVSGGSVFAGDGVAATNAAGEAVYPVTVSDLASLVPPVAITGLERYGTYGIYPDENGKVCLWLPDGMSVFAVGGRYFTATVRGGAMTAKPLPIVENVEYLDWNGLSMEMEAKTCPFAFVLTDEFTTIGGDVWFVVSGEVKTSGLVVKGRAHLILADGAKLEAGSVSGGALAVYGQANGSGVLSVSGDMSCALTAKGGRIDAGTMSGEALEVFGGTVRTDCGGLKMAVNGGSVLAGDAVTATNAAGRAVHPVTASGLASLVPPVAISGLERYGTSGIWPDEEGNVHLWLPDGEHWLTVGGVPFYANVEGGPTEAMKDPVSTTYWDVSAGESKRVVARLFDGSFQTLGTGCWYVVTGAVSTADVQIDGLVRLVLADDATLKVMGGISGDALVVYGQANGSGILTASGDISCDLTVNGGRISAEKASGETLAVRGGTLKADRGEREMFVSGGSVIAGDGVAATNAAGEAVYPVAVSGLTSLVPPIAVAGLGDYCTYGIYPDGAGKVCLWLPNGRWKFSFAAGGETLKCYALVADGAVTVECYEPTTIGVSADGVDVGTCFGTGWWYSYASRRLTILQPGEYALSGAASNVTVDVLADVAVQFDVLALSDVEGPAITVADGKTLTVMRGTADLRGTEDVSGAVVIHGGSIVLEPGFATAPSNGTERVCRVTADLNVLGEFGEYRGLPVALTGFEDYDVSGVLTSAKDGTVSFWLPSGRGIFLAESAERAAYFRYDTTDGDTVAEILTPEDINLFVNGLNVMYGPRDGWEFDMSTQTLTLDGTIDGYVINGSNAEVKVVAKGAAVNVKMDEAMVGSFSVSEGTQAELVFAGDGCAIDEGIILPESGNGGLVVKNGTARIGKVSGSAQSVFKILGGSLDIAADLAPVVPSGAFPERAILKTVVTVPKGVADDRPVRVAGLGDYGVEELYPHGGKLFLYPPEVTDVRSRLCFTVNGHYFYLPEGRLEGTELFEVKTGFTVDGVDCGEGRGAGWSYDICGTTLLLDDPARTYVLFCTNDVMEWAVTPTVTGNAVRICGTLSRPAEGRDFAGAFVIAGGNLIAAEDDFAVAPTNAAGQAVHPVALTLPSDVDPSLPVTSLMEAAVSGYSTEAMQAVDRALCLWLPDGTNLAFTVNGARCRATVEGGLAEAEYRETGVTVDGVDCAAVTGSGWMWSPITKNLYLEGGHQVDGVSALDRVILLGGNGAAITDGTTDLPAEDYRGVAIRGGSHRFDGAFPLAPSNGLARVWRVTTDVSDVATNGEPVSVECAGWSGTNICSRNGFVYLWLPDSDGRDVVFSVNGMPRNTRVDGADTVATNPVIGLTVNGTDLGRGFGDGWFWDFTTGELALFEDGCEYVYVGRCEDDRAHTVITNSLKVTFDRAKVVARMEDSAAFTTTEGAETTFRFVGYGNAILGTDGATALAGEGSYVIEGGTVEIGASDVGASVKGPVMIKGGSVFVAAPTEFAVPPINAASQRVYRVTVPMPRRVTRGRALDIVGLPDSYDVSEIYSSDDGFVYLWLPTNAVPYAFTVDGYAYHATVTGAWAEATYDEPLTGVTVNGADCAYLNDRGWTWSREEGVLYLSGEAACVIEGVNAEGLVSIAVTNENALTTVRFTGLHLSGLPDGRSPVDVRPGAKLRIDVLKGARSELAGNPGGYHTGKSGTAGIHVPEGASLEIKASVVMGGSDDDFAELVVTGGRLAAGIGGNAGEAMGEVTVSAYRISATGGDRGAGIGGGSRGAGGTLFVTGGEIIAKGGAGVDGSETEDELGGAGIGGGYNGDGGTVAISGGLVTAIGGAGGAVIGGGAGGDGGALTISGGTVYTTEADAAILGASVFGNGSGGKPGVNVFLGGSIGVTNGMIRAEASNATERVTLVTIAPPAEILADESYDGGNYRADIYGLPADYGTKDIFMRNGYVYLWLPDGDYEFTLNDIAYTVSVKDGIVTESHYKATGVRVNGRDVCFAEGPGWAWTPATGALSLSKAMDYVVSGESSGSNVFVYASGNARVVVSNFVEGATNDVPLQARAGSRASFRFAGERDRFADFGGAGTAVIAGGNVVFGRITGESVVVKGGNVFVEGAFPTNRVTDGENPLVPVTITLPETCAPDTPVVFAGLPDNYDAAGIRAIGGKVCVWLPFGEYEIDATGYGADGSANSYSKAISVFDFGYEESDIRYVVVPDGKGGEVAVPCLWVDMYGLVGADASTEEYRQAVLAPSQNDGFLVWQSFMAGLDPTDPNDRFFAVIEILPGDVVSVGPNELRANRVYKVVASKDLSFTDTVTGAVGKTGRIEVDMSLGYRFFKVIVGLE